MRLSPRPAQGVPIQKTPSPVRSSVLPGSGGTSSPKSGGGDFRSSTPHDGETMKNCLQEHNLIELCEPKCSRFDYEEKTLEKIIRMEVSIQNKLEEYKELKNCILMILQQVNNERKDLENENENMQVRKTQYFLIQHSAFF